MSAIIETTVDGSTVESEITVPRRIRRFFSGEPFRAEYGVDVSNVHPALAPIPALAHVCPVAWANGVDVTVPTLDSTYLDALRTVRDVLVGMYPEFMQGGSVSADTVVDVAAERSPDDFADSALLFTGGVDSVASYIRHRDEEPALVCIQGWVVNIDENDRWAGAKRHVEEFAGAHDLNTHYIRSNMLSFLDGPMLQAHYKRFVDGAWYSAVGHGLGLLGLCVPLADARGFGTVHIAASHTDEFAEPWGSHPDIEDNVRWARSRGNHDGYELTRQEKIERIAEYATSENERFRLRTCSQSAAGDNCNDCEKCYRTICGLVLAGLDPNEFGYEATPATFDAVRRGFETGAFVFDEHVAFHWRDIQNHLDPDREYPVDGAREFFEWFDTVDVDAVADDSNPPVHHVILRGIARNIPYPVYARVYPVYKSLEGRVR